MTPRVQSIDAYILSRTGLLLYNECDPLSHKQTQKPVLLFLYKDARKPTFKKVTYYI